MSYADALMKRTAALSLATIVFFAFLTMPPNANAAKNPVAGAKCLKINSKVEFKGKLFTCVKVKGKTVWNKGVLIKPVTPGPASSNSPSPTPTPTPSATISSTPTPTPTPTPSVTLSSTPTPAPTPTPTQILYTLERVRANNSSSSCWTIIDGFVYDLTSWISAHPGGPGVIRSMCGTDGTNAFKAQHQNQMSPAQRLNGYLLGPLSR